MKSQNKISKVSVCMIIYNEEKIIERALKSVYGFVDEIIVIHDGPCLDNSLKISKKYGAKIFIRPRVGEAEPHRPFSFEIARNNWILQLDADEYLSPQLQKALSELVSNEVVSCYEFIWPYWNGQKYLTKFWPLKKALFRKDRIVFTAFPHAEVLVDGITKRTNLRLEHKPNYDNLTFKAFKNKHLKWAKIHAAYLLKDKSTFVTFPKDKPVQLPRYYFITKHPYLYTLPLASYQALFPYITGGFKSGLLGFKSSILIFFYYFSMGIEVGKLKRLKL